MSKKPLKRRTDDEADSIVDPPGRQLKFPLRAIKGFLDVQAVKVNRSLGLTLTATKKR